MDHCVKINGYDYTITGGMVNISGWSYEISQGIVKVNNFDREILFTSPVSYTSIECRTYDILYEPDDPLVLPTKVEIRSDTEGRQTITREGDWSITGNTVTLNINVAKCNGDSWIRIFGDIVAEDTKGSVSYDGVDITGQSIIIDIVSTYSESYVTVVSDPLG